MIKQLWKQLTGKRRTELSGAYYMMVNDTHRTKVGIIHSHDNGTTYSERIEVEFTLGMLTNSLDVKTITLYDAISHEMVGMRRLPKVLVMEANDTLTIEWNCQLHGTLLTI